MASSIHEFSDTSEADEQQESSEPQLQPLTPTTEIPNPYITSPNIQYPTAPNLAPGNMMGQAAYPYPDPYYRSVFAPYEAQTNYPTQSYPAQPMAHLQYMGMQQAGVPLKSDAVDGPVFVNAKQYHGILRRRQSRAKAESENKTIKSRKPYLHESRHQHALKRARGCGGRFLNSKETGNQHKEDNGKGNNSQDK